MSPWLQIPHSFWGRLPPQFFPAPQQRAAWCHCCWPQRKQTSTANHLGAVQVLLMVCSASWRFAQNSIIHVVPGWVHWLTTRADSAGDLCWRCLVTRFASHWKSLATPNSPWWNEKQIGPRYGTIDVSCTVHMHVHECIHLCMHLCMHYIVLDCIESHGIPLPCISWDNNGTYMHNHRCTNKNRMQKWICWSTYCRCIGYVSVHFILYIYCMLEPVYVLVNHGEP